MKKLQLIPSGYGHYKVTITYYGKQYYKIVSDMHLIDAYLSEEGGVRITPKQANELLYDAVKQWNNLGKYKY